VTLPAAETIFGILDQVKDPEVPVLSVVELGIIRGVRWVDGALHIDITPTYSGCPALRAIEDDIRAELARHGHTAVHINLVYAPPWTTDWIPPEAKEKLRQYGIAPPGPVEDDGLVTITPRRQPTPCPFCSSLNTERTSEFGSTACKSLHKCHGCHQPFEHFKPF